MRVTTGVQHLVGDLLLVDGVDAGDKPRHQLGDDSMVVRLVGPILIRSKTPIAIICEKRCQLQRYRIIDDKVVGSCGVKSIQSGKNTGDVVTNSLTGHLAVCEKVVQPKVVGANPHEFQRFRAG